LVILVLDSFGSFLVLNNRRLVCFRLVNVKRVLRRRLRSGISNSQILLLPSSLETQYLRFSVIRHFLLHSRSFFLFHFLLHFLSNFSVFIIIKSLMSMFVQFDNSDQSNQSNDSDDSSSFGTHSCSSRSPGQLSGLLSIRRIKLIASHDWVHYPSDISDQ